jgi:hypothetical protein
MHRRTGSSRIPPRASITGITGPDDTAIMTSDGDVTMHGSTTTEDILRRKLQEKEREVDKVSS